LNIKKEDVKKNITNPQFKRGEKAVLFKLKPFGSSLQNTTQNVKKCSIKMQSQQ